MRRLLVRVKRSNLTSYTDIFINHGVSLAFPMLVAHNYHFFGNFDNLALLDVLLKYRRGYNIGLGSKRRKIYFSDVNKILLSVGEFRISCCEVLRDSESLKFASALKGCTSCIHEISNDEGCELCETEFDQSMDVSEGDVLSKHNSKPKATVSEISKIHRDTEVESSFSKLIYKLLSFGKMKIEDIFTKKEILTFKKNKKEREELKNEYNKSNEALKREMMSIPEIRMVTYNGFMGDEARASNYYDILVHVKRFFDLYDYCMEPLTDLYSFYKENGRDFFTLQKDKIMCHVNDYLKRAGEKGFLTPFQIEHRCKKFHLKERVDFYNKQNDDLMALRVKCLELRSQGKPTPNSEYSSLRDVVSKLKGELSSMMSAYDSIDKDFEDPLRFSRPVILKQYFNLFEGNNDDVLDFWAVLKRGEEQENPFKDVLEKHLEKVKEDLNTKECEGSKQLADYIESTYVKEREYILEVLNSNGEISKERLNESYNEIKCSRKNFLDSRYNKTFNFDHLHLNNFEKAELDKLIEELIEDEYEYSISKKRLLDKTIKEIYCPQNVRIFNRDYDVGKNLSESEWVSEVFKIREEGMMNVCNHYEGLIAKFAEICGFSPYGVIIGSCVDGVWTADSTLFPESEEGGNIVNGFNPQQNYLDDIIKKASMEKRGLGNFTDSGCSYLVAAKKGIVRDQDSLSKSKIAQINSKMGAEKESFQSRCEIRGRESLYDSLMSLNEARSGSSNQCKEVGLKKGMKIEAGGKKMEGELAAKILRRKFADSLYQKTLYKSIKASKNVYEELEVEEAISETNYIVDNVLSDYILPYSCFDFKSMREYRMKKINELGNDYCPVDKGVERICEFNKFNMDNNSRAHKKYDVVGMISYVKLLLSMKILKLNVSKACYSVFGLKKCQSTYLKSSLVKLANGILENGNYRAPFCKF